MMMIMMMMADFDGRFGDKQRSERGARNGAKIRPAVRSTAVIAAGRGNDALPGSG